MLVAAEDRMYRETDSDVDGESMLDFEIYNNTNKENNCRRIQEIFFRVEDSSVENELFVDHFSWFSFRLSVVDVSQSMSNCLQIHSENIEERLVWISM